MSKSKKIFIAALLTMLVQANGYTQTAAQGAEQNPVIEERLRDAQVTEQRLSNGATLTEIKFAGSLQPNVDLGCVPLHEVSNGINAPALIYAAKKCIRQGDDLNAWHLISTGLGFAYYDIQRVADRSAKGARDVLMMNAFSDLPVPLREQMQSTFKGFQSDPQRVSSYCAELKRIGPPSYDAQWAIKHGIGAYQEPRNGAYLANFDADAVWNDIVKVRCTASKS